MRKHGALILAMLDDNTIPDGGIFIGREWHIITNAIYNFRHSAIAGRENFLTEGKVIFIVFAIGFMAFPKSLEHIKIKSISLVFNVMMIILFLRISTPHHCPFAFE